MVHNSTVFAIVICVANQILFQLFPVHEQFYVDVYVLDSWPIAVFAA